MMLKRIGIMIAVTVLCTVTVYAGDIPYALLGEDRAKLYIGKMIAYDGNEETAVIRPVRKIKGDIDLEVNKKISFTEKNVIQGGETVELPIFWNTGGIPFQKNEKCLVIEFGNYHDNYLFHISGDNPNTLKIKNIRGMDMWETLQKFLNEGKYGEAETARLEKLGIAAPAVAEYANPSAEKSETIGLDQAYVFLVAATAMMIAISLRIRRKQHDIKRGSEK